MMATRIYLEKMVIGWRIVGEALPSATGLHLPVRVYSRRLRKSNAVAMRDDISRRLDRTVSFHRERAADNERRLSQQIEL